MNSSALPNMVPRFAFFALASLLAIVCGSFAIWRSDGSTAMAFGNLIGWGIGLMATTAILFMPKIPKAAEISLAATIVALAATFTDSGLSGVHRWISIGPLRANIAALLLPTLVTVLSFRQTRPALAALAWLAAMILLAAQPDPSQATALAIAAPLLFAHWRSKWRWSALAATVALTMISWLRPDPLQPVTEVEGIVQLMWQISPALAALGLAALAATIVAVRQADISAAAFAAYCAVVAVMPALGHFPVPLVGAGISFPLGWWLGVAILLHSQKKIGTRA
jgi:hypothetical protein